jgi:branched-chain amino acid transport system ATP-binding protein
VIELLNVKIRYGVVEAIKGISLKVGAGEIATLIGSNGAGKSTTLRGISGLTPPYHGEIRFLDQRIEKLPTPDIIKLGIAHCPEGRRIFPRMTVIGNLNLGAYLQNDKKAIAEVRENILERFPILRDRKRQLAGTLSGGEQQMLAIGRTLMSRPKLLLLDEPSLGLSPLLVSEIARIITSINTQGVAIILVEQNANMALELANTGFVLETGRIVLEGPANELKENEHVRRAYLGG